MRKILNVTYSDWILNLILLYRLAVTYHSTAQWPDIILSSRDQLKIRQITQRLYNNVKI